MELKVILTIVVGCILALAAWFLFLQGVVTPTT